ncbi:MAG: YihY/virulence factor BrkB family protein [Candidatus Sumerlaeaceae bacterium]|nr:YihY/virulence factor BrkB family protein [Candidatus Sumerlaeaceae bacterium]
MRFLRLAGVLAREVFFKWHRDQVPRMGAALAYYTVFSLAPLLLVAIAVSAVFFGEQAARAETVARLEEFMGPKGAAAVQTLVANAQRPASGTAATVVGVLLVLYGATRIFTELRHAFNVIWGVERQGVSMIRMAVLDRLLALAMVLGTGVVLIGSLAASTALQAMQRRFALESAGIGPLVSRTYTISSFCALLVMFAAIFKLMPATRVAWRDVWAGAFITSGLFAVGKYLIGMYLARTTATSVYGAAGSLVILLWWIYYSVLILLLGAVITRVYSQRVGSQHRARRH